ncbi:MAG: CDGSH iron-sulfur domain-containing protein [Chitinophagales bacterium]
MKNKEKVNVYTKPNGPIIITGKFVFENEEGETKEMERLVLCRCGNSGKMPLCDASHNRIGFQSKM